MALFARAPLLGAAFFAMAPLLCALAQNEIQMTLYIHHNLYAANQPLVALVSRDKYFGQTFVQDLPVRDGPDPNANKVIGRAQGLSMIANQTSAGLDMYTSFNLVFSDETRYGGSTLQMTGIHYFYDLGLVREYSIVGGTGEFIMARGVAKYENVKTDKLPGFLYKVNVHAYYYSSMDSTMVSGKSACNLKDK